MLTRLVAQRSNFFLNEKPLNEKPFEKKIIENGFEPWVVPLTEISTIKPRSSTKKVSYNNFS